MALTNHAALSAAAHKLAAKYRPSNLIKPVYQGAPKNEAPRKASVESMEVTVMSAYIEACEHLDAPVDTTMQSKVAKLVESANTDRHISGRISDLLDDAGYMRRLERYNDRTTLAKEVRARLMRLVQSYEQAAPEVDTAPDDAVPLPKAVGISLAITGVVMVFMYWALNAIFY